jgi:hypothetical protein
MALFSPCRWSRCACSEESLPGRPVGRRRRTFCILQLKLRFLAAKPPPSHIFEQVALAAAEESGEYF